MVIIGHSSSKSTFGANKKKTCIMVIINPIESGSSWSVCVHVHHIGHYLTGWSRWESLRATHVTEEETNSGGIPWALSISFPLTEGCHVPGGRDKGLPGFESCSGLVL